MRQVGHGRRRVGLDHPDAYGLMFGVDTRLPDAVEQIGEHQQRAFAPIIDAVTAAQAAGTATAGDYQATALSI